MPRITITVADSSAQPYRFNLDRKSVTLGRGSENDIVLDSASVSVKHAEMRRIHGGYELADLGSTNGISIDGTRREVIPLQSGMIASIGDVQFHFLLTDEEIQTLQYEKTSRLSPETSATSAHREAVEYSYPAPSGGSFATKVLFVFLAAAAFFAGLAIRHQRDTGASLIDAIKVKVFD
jgi:pSer/pThr/pTyr-binding forkhead associated (FHA) protein